MYCTLLYGILYCANFVINMLDIKYMFEDDTDIDSHKYAK